MSRLRTSFQVGDRVEAEAGPIAHGGHVVARVTDPQAPADARPVVVFVRHALPGERVVIEITEVDKSFLRGDAVEVLEASPHRVPAPCPVSGPGACGGCDFQHVALDAQRELKASVVGEQLRRLAGIEREVVVEPPPTSKAYSRVDGLRWRTRMQYVPTPGGGRGLRKHRSHEAVPVSDCLIAAPNACEVVDRAPADVLVTERVRDRSFQVAADGFWQVHPNAPEALVGAVLELLEPRRGDRVLDLYAGVGLFSAFIVEAVGLVGHVTSIEGDRKATELCAENLADHPNVDVRLGRVDRVLATHDVGHVDLVVLDPPREGAKRVVVEQVAGLGPRRVVYVACDPAALARDVATFAENGYRLEDLRAFDIFPMTHHVECVALLERH